MGNTLYFPPQNRGTTGQQNRTCECVRQQYLRKKVSAFLVLLLLTQALDWRELKLSLTLLCKSVFPDEASVGQWDCYIWHWIWNDSDGATG